MMRIVLSCTQLKSFTDSMQSESPKKVEDGETIHSRVFWSDILGTYCALYGCDPWRTYCDAPFDFFIELSRQAIRQEALQNMRLATAVGVGFGGDKNGKTWSRWTKQAKHAAPPKSMEKLMTEPLSEDQMKAEREKLKEYVRKHNQ